ncbi:helix-turn-helix domain-containing protein [Edaphobacillus lindanitolerans]|uniref:Uncharacterized protein YpbB n=1 Tax=Edaphobacillus lindanitolerans TaxID=550447 RepID=A0A1U7PL51_9BACI|nr:helix-turn-helix domain-containing protein [Edaphobacillus lindanitolerans]SIT66626.1 Uncharacterized protein YpbB [Edaphobacillus lindanitolerans]
MSFEDILLTIISRMDGERYKHAAFHLMKGKRSGQTLQDTEYYGLHPFFGMLPSLSGTDFDRAYNGLLEKGRISESPEGIVRLTMAGNERARALPDSRLNGWVYRGKEQVFFSRLSLAVQSLSHLMSGIRGFLPVTNDPAIQQDVRRHLLAALKTRSPDDFRMEMTHSLEQSGMDGERLSRLVARLSGNGLTGLTWTQLSELSGLEVIDLKAEFVESLHIWLQVIENGRYPLLSGFAEGLRPSSPLTGSARKTEELYRKGVTLEEIAARRGLKISTIEDHFIEIAINDPVFPLGRFVSDDCAETVMAEMNRLATRKLSLLKKKFPELSYFQLRLIMARAGKEESDGNERTGESDRAAEADHRA